MTGGPFFKSPLCNPYGRELLLYGREPVSSSPLEYAPPGESATTSHLHWHARREEGVAYSELGAGVFTADTMPERTARELRAVAIDEF